MARENPPGYRPPILASIFRGFGLVTFVLAVFALFLIVLIYCTRPHYERREIGAGGLFASLLPVLGSICTALFFYGVGEIMNLIGLIAFNTGRLRELAEGQSVTARAGKVSTLAAVAPQATRPAVGPARVGLPLPQFYYQAGGVAIGPVSEAELQKLANQGRIDADTYICAEGSQDWRRLEEMNAA